MFTYEVHALLFLLQLSHHLYVFLDAGRMPIVNTASQTDVSATLNTAETLTSRAHRSKKKQRVKLPNAEPTLSVGKAVAESTVCVPLV